MSQLRRSYGLRPAPLRLALPLRTTHCSSWTPRIPNTSKRSAGSHWAHLRKDMQWKKMRGLFFTNLEERGETVAIDVRRKKIVSRWRSGCPEPHGVALDEARRFLF